MYEFNPSGRMAYLTGETVDADVFQCAVNADGTLGSCSTVTLLTPPGFYVSDQTNNAIYGCDTASNNTSNFNSCFLAKNLSSPWGIAVME